MPGKVGEMHDERSAERDRLWTVSELADHMRVSNMTVYRLIKAGELPALRVGKNYRLRGSDIAAYLDASCTQREEAHEG
jgi:excisionase family DNA binding protein